jgi:adenylate cyclase class 2
MEGVATEVELKARLDDTETCLQRMKQLADAEGVGPFHKKDIYFVHPRLTNEESLFRLRVENGQHAFVTRKQKRFSGRVEVNREIEYEVSDARTFEEFCHSLGYTVYVVKEKQGFSCKTPEGITIELAEVTGLGMFVELEIILPDSEHTQKAKEKLYAALDLLEVSSAAVEPRYYIDLLLSEERQGLQEKPEKTQ